MTIAELDRTINRLTDYKENNPYCPDELNNAIRELKKLYTRKMIKPVLIIIGVVLLICRCRKANKEKHI